MTRRRLALYTFGVFRMPFDDPANDSFHALNDLILPIVDRAHGMVARSGYDGDPGPASWGEHAYPRFFTGEGHSPSTLSLWTSIEAAMAFSYFGLHREALKRGSEWNLKPTWPPYAAWWADDEMRPDWTEAVGRHDHLHQHGPNPHVFEFKTPFDADGKPYIVDRALIKQIATANDAASRAAV